MINAAIACCVVFLIGLITSYWWGVHSRFTLGSRLFYAKGSSSNDGTSDSTQTATKALAFDYIFERPKASNASANRTVKSAVNDAVVVTNSVSPSTSSNVSTNAPSTGNVPQLYAVKKPVATKIEAAPQSLSSQAPSSSTPSSQAQSSPAQPSQNKSDDLKQIFGIGVVFENLLNSIGISTFDQLANIGAEDMETVRASLGVYSARIEKDNWIAQATQLHDFHHNQKIAV